MIRLAAVGALTALLLIAGAACSSSASSDKEVKSLKATIAALTDSTPVPTANQEPRAEEAAGGKINYVYEAQHYTMTLQNAYRSSQNEVLLLIQFVAKDAALNGTFITCCTNAITTDGAVYDLLGDGPGAIRPGGAGTFCLGSNDGIPIGSAITALTLDSLLVEGGGFSGEDPEIDVPDILVSKLSEIKSSSDMPASCA